MSYTYTLPLNTASADNAPIIQAAIDSKCLIGGGSILLPPGIFNTSTLTIPSASVELYSLGGTTLKNTNISASILNIYSSFSGASNITFDGGRTTEGSYGYFGTINIESSGSMPPITGSFIRDCTIKNCVFMGIYVQGNMTGVEILNNDVSNCFVSITTNSTGNGCPQRTRILNNRFHHNYTAASYSGGVKVARNGGLSTMEGYGNIITGNTILSAGEMGIEVWGSGGNECIIDGNIVKGNSWGISLDSSVRSIVANNRVSEFTTIGIELASATTDCVVEGNFVSAYTSETGSIRNSGEPVQCSGVGHARNLISGNKLLGTSLHAVHVLGGERYIVKGNSIYDCGGSVNIVNTNYVSIRGNIFDSIVNGGVFIDLNGIDMTDIELCDNSFLGTGSNAYDPITIYDAGNGHQLKNCTITNNIMLCKYKYYTLNWSMPVANLVNFVCVRNHSSNLGAPWTYLNDYISTDVIDPGIPTTAYKYGYVFNAQGIVTIAEDNVNYRWYKVYARSDTGGPLEAGFAFNYDYAGTKHVSTYRINASPYSQECSIVKFPSSLYAGINLLSEVIYNNASGPFHEVWIKVQPIAASGSFDFWTTEPSSYIFNNHSGSTVEPTWGATYYKSKSEIANSHLSAAGFESRNGFFAGPYNSLISSTPKAKLVIRGGQYWGTDPKAVARFESESGSLLFQVYNSGDTVVSGSVAVSGSVRDQYGNLRSIPQNVQTASYTLVINDMGRHIYTSGSVTVPASVFSAGDAVSVVNSSSGSLSIIQGSSVTLRLAGTETTGSRTLAQYGMGTITCGSSNVFFVTGTGLT